MILDLNTDCIYSHINKTSTYEDPRKWGSAEAEEIPEPREIHLERHPELGFGFVAGSEKPVIVRWVATLLQAIDCDKHKYQKWRDL